MSPEKSKLVALRISKAKETLDEVDILIENRLWNTSVNRLYYACFYAVSALLAQHDIEAKTHSGTQRMFGLHFIKTGKINEEYGGFYSSLFGMRQKADYEDIVEYEKTDVMSLLPLATDLINHIANLLSNLESR